MPAPDTGVIAAETGVPRDVQDAELRAHELLQVLPRQYLVLRCDLCFFLIKTRRQKKSSSLGTWDTGSFGNDAALDYLQTVNDIQKVASTIRHNYSGYIDADAACEVVAACEIIATMLNRPAPDVPEEAIARFGSLEVPDEELLADARDVLKSVSISSELADLWAEEEDKEWKEAIADLSSRLDTDSDYERPAFAEAALGPVHAVCILCELSIPDEDAVDLIHEVDDGIVFSSMTLHAHRRCVEKVFGPPHWNSDGTPSDGVLRQFAQFVDTESGT